VFADKLDTLSQWAVVLFGGVRQGGKEQMKFSTWKPADPVWEAAGCMYHIESVTDQHLLVLVWPLPCLQSSYPKKPEAYLSHLISHGILRFPACSENGCQGKNINIDSGHDVYNKTTKLNKSMSKLPVVFKLGVNLSS
jgi:hypothetical protein